MTLPLPIRAPYSTLTLFINTLLSPISTFLSMKQNGPISQFSPILASGSMKAKGLILLINSILLVFYDLCSKCGFGHDAFSHKHITAHGRDAMTYRRQQFYFEKEGISRNYFLAEFHLVYA